MCGRPSYKNTLFVRRLQHWNGYNNKTDMSFFERIILKAKTHWLFPLIWITLVSIIVVLLFSPWTSATNPYMRYDSSVYAVIGKAWAYTDFLPYRDFFDHKGPMVYLYYMLASLIYHDNIKVGISIIQAIFLSSSLYIIYRTTLMFQGKRVAWLVIFSFLIFYIAYIGEGGNTEEISMPFMLLPLYILLRDIKTDKLKISDTPPIGSFLIIGGCIGIHILVRITNAASSCACLLVYTMAYIRFLRWKTIARILLASGLGSACMLLPFIVYILSQDLLRDYIQCNFTFNFQYIAKTESTAHLTAQALSCPYLVILPVCCCLNRFLKAVAPWKELAYIVVASCTFLVTLIGHCYTHYLLLSSPGYLCSILFCCDIAKCSISRYKTTLVTSIAIVWALPLIPLLSPVKLQLRESICLFLVSHERILTKITKGYFGPHSRIAQLAEKCSQRKYKAVERAHRKVEIPRKALQNIARIIPEKDKNSILVYGGFGWEYLTLDMWPCCKYFIVQDTLASYDKNGDFSSIVQQSVIQAAPKWIILSKELTKKDSLIYFIINPGYQKVLEEGGYELYHAQAEYHPYNYPHT